MIVNPVDMIFLIENNIFPMARRIFDERHTMKIIKIRSVSIRITLDNKFVKVIVSIGNNKGYTLQNNNKWDERLVKNQTNDRRYKIVFISQENHASNMV